MHLSVTELTVRNGEPGPAVTTGERLSLRVDATAKEGGNEEGDTKTGQSGT